MSLEHCSENAEQIKGQGELDKDRTKGKGYQKQQQASSF